VIRSTLYLISLLALTALAAGCERGAAPERGEAARGATTAHAALAARVNGAEISVQQLAHGMNPPTSGTGSPAQALEKVIDRELLAQKALQAKLDREPQVAQAIDAARRQVLAQAWLDRAAAAAVKSSADEVSAFYAENPALFAQRRVYRLREMAVGAGTSFSQDALERVRSEAATAKDLEEAAGWLRWRGFKVGAVSYTTAAAEQLPLAYLPQLARMREGEIAVLGTGGAGASVVQLVGAQDAPLSEQQAAPVIRQFIAGRKRMELAAAEVKRLREAASIEYVGDFKR
jgi:EpsD family peptidyl-prolyl cis-trans isomerase